MVNTKGKKVMLLVMLFAIMLFAHSALAVDRIYTLTATYNGQELKDGQTYEAVEGATIYVSVNPQYVDDSLLIGHKWGNDDMVVDASGSKTASFTVPNIAPGTTKELQIESLIKYHHDQSDAYVGNSNLLDVFLKAPKGDNKVDVDLYKGSNKLSESQVYEVKAGDTLRISVTPTDTFDALRYEWKDAEGFEDTHNNLEVTVPNYESGKEFFINVRGMDKYGNRSTLKTYHFIIPKKEEKITISLKDNALANDTAKKTVENGEFDHYDYSFGPKSEGGSDKLDKKQTSDTFEYTDYIPGVVFVLKVQGVTKTGVKSNIASLEIYKEKPVESIVIELKDNGTDATAKVVEVNNGEFDHYTYSWDSAKPTPDTTGKYAYPEQPGKHTLTVIGYTKNNVASEPKTLTITVPEKETPIDYKGEVKAEMPDGKEPSENKDKPTEPKDGDVVKAIFDPEANFNKFEYAWDDDEFKPIPEDRKIKFPNMTPGVLYKLTIRGILKNGKLVEKVYYFMVPKQEENKEPDKGGELDIDPWMRRNPDAEGLLVSLRNRSELSKANQNFYMVDEEVIYLIDYMNAGKEITDEVRVVFNVPLEFKVVDSDGGKVDKEKRTITWTFPYGLVKDAEDTLVVKLKYTALSNKSYKEEMIYPQAVIYKGSKAQDYSAVINCIYLDEDTVFSYTHKPYMYGDEEAPTFRPDDGIKRCEGALVLVRIFEEPYLNIKDITTKYSDIEDTYFVARQAITKATQLGIMSGYPDGKFMPNDKMTRAEFMRVIASYIEESAKVKGLDVKSNKAITIYKNTERANHWAIPYVTLLARLNMTSASAKEKDLRIDDIITRAEVAQLCNFFLFRAPAKITMSTIMDFVDVSKTHALVEDIVEATRVEHTFTVLGTGKERMK